MKIADKVDMDERQVRKLANADHYSWSYVPLIAVKSLFDFANSIKKIKVRGVPQSQAAAFPRHQEEEETDKTKQAQIEQMYEKHLD